MNKYTELIHHVNSDSYWPIVRNYFAEFSEFASIKNIEATKYVTDHYIQSYDTWFQFRFRDTVYDITNGRLYFFYLLQCNTRNVQIFIFISQSVVLRSTWVLRKTHVIAPELLTNRNCESNMYKLC